MAFNEDIPENFVKEAMALDALGIVQLYKIEMFPPSPNTAVTLYLNDKADLVWQGVTWEGCPLNLTGELLSSTGEQGRPKFTLTNPDGLFSVYVHQGWLNNAIVTRYKVLTTDIENDVNSYVRNVWRVGKVAGLDKTTVVIELRGILDGHFFTLPGRRYQPPEFPHVSLE